MRLLIPMLLLVACSGQPKVPKDILPPQKMESILWDFMRADALMMNPVPSDSLGGRQVKRTELYQQVLYIHKTDKASFDRSLKFYEHHPDLLEDVFKIMDKRVDKQPDLTPDSIRKRKPILPKAMLK